MDKSNFEKILEQVRNEGLTEEKRADVKRTLIVMSNPNFILAEAYIEYLEDKVNDLEVELMDLEIELDLL